MKHSIPPRLGIEELVGRYLKKIQKRRLGLLAHPASVTPNFVHTLDVLRGVGAKVQVLFGPEHGFGGEAQDMEPVAGLSKGPYDLPFYSLYGQDESSLTPPREVLDDLDALVVDLADIGSRYYTFVWTALLCLRACYTAGIQMIVTDRPNPLGGERVEGAPQKEGFLSFVGLKPVSNRHGMTACELLLMAASDEGLDEALTVIPMQGWERAMGYGETGLPWVMPSPNMPTLDTALVYPGLCLIEGTWASEGRGTTRPFELVGAPEIDSKALCSRLDGMKLPGVRFRPVTFKPGFQKHGGAICGGAQLHVTDQDIFLPYRTGVAVLIALFASSGGAFSWRRDPYEFVSMTPAIDLLSGSEELRYAIENGAALGEIADTWREGESAFEEQRKRFLLY